MLTFVRKHPLLSYYTLTFTISWGGFVIAVGPHSLVSSNWQAEGKFAAAVIVMLAGPSIAGLTLTGLLDGRAGFRELWQRLLKWRVGARWYVIAIFPAIVVCAGVLLVLSLTSTLFTAEHKMPIIFGGLFAGASTLLEEIGWTGFVVPRLRRQHSVLMAGLIVGVLWGVWHFLQQVFISGTYAGDIPVALFLLLSFAAAIASLTAYRILLVWLYDRTGSLLVTTVMHGVLSASSIFWFSAPATGVVFLADVWLVAAAFWLIVGVVAVNEGWLIGKEERDRPQGGRRTIALEEGSRTR